MTFALLQTVSAAAIVGGTINWEVGSYTAGMPAFGSPVSQTLVLTATDGFTTTDFNLTISGQTSSDGDRILFFDVDQPQGGQPDNVFKMQRNGIDASSTTSLTFTFDVLLSDVEFTIVDIDSCKPISEDPTPCYRDKVTVLGLNGNTPVAPIMTATNPAKVGIVGNVATATEESGNAWTDSTDGNVLVKFHDPIQSYVIFYGNTPEATDAADQHIAISTVGFACPEPLSPLAVTLSNGRAAAATFATPILLWVLALASLTGYVLLKRTNTKAAG